MADLPVIHTHAFNNGRKLSRLNTYRLKAAQRRRDNAIADANERYAREVAALTGSNDRAATLALTRHQAANARWGTSEPAPALADPLEHAMTWAPAARAARAVILGLLASHGIRQRREVPGL